MRRLLFFLSLATTFAWSASAWADKIAILPFASDKNVPRPELDEIRAWTQQAALKQGHSYASDSEMLSARSAVQDGIADTTQEYRAAGESVGAAWTLRGRVERNDHPPARLPNGTEEEGWTTYRVELEAYQLGSGRLESLSRDVLPDEGPNDIAAMIALLVRPQGIANAELPWQNLGVRRPKPKPRPAAPPLPPPPPPPPPAPEAPPRPRLVYGAGHPFAIGGSAGISSALVRPDQARGPSSAMPVGVVLGYALPDAAPGLELRANVTSQVIGPRALELSAGARYAFAPVRDLRFFVGPELLLGTHVALGADKTARFLTHGSVFVAYGITENLQVELAGDLAAALGGTGTLLLGGGTGRVVLRF